MKSVWLKRKNSSRLVLFFSGFASDENLLKNADFGDFDVLMFYDYSDLQCAFDPAIFKYEKVYTLAWSFGVWVADFFRKDLPKCAMRVALCGSPKPVDDDFGIPQKVFDATLKNYCSENRDKFFLRVFGAGNFKNCAEILSKRSAESERYELEFLGKAFKNFSASADNWDRAICAKNDKIFALKNMRNVWQTKMETLDCEHFPQALLNDGFEWLFDDFKSVQKVFSKSFAKYENSAAVQKKIAAYLAKLTLKRLDASAVKSVLEIGMGTGFLTRLLAEKLANADWYLNDLSAKSAEYIPEILHQKCKFIAGDARIQDLPKGMDLVVSASCFQWFENLEKFVLKIAKISNSGAIFAFSSFLPENFCEIRALAGRGLNYIGLVGLKSMLLKAGFEILCAETETVKLEFKSPADVLRHLRDTGVTGGFAEFWTPQKLKSFSKQYSDFFAGENGGVCLTYRPVYIVCKFVGNKK